MSSGRFFYLLFKALAGFGVAFMGTACATFDLVSCGKKLLGCSVCCLREDSCCPQAVVRVLDSLVCRMKLRLTDKSFSFNVPM